MGPTTQTKQASPRAAIRSALADDPAFAPLLDMFVDELPDRISALETAWQAAALDDVRTLAHQLKGAGGGYGYPDVTDAARELETAIKSGDQADHIRQLIDELEAVCQAVVRGRN